MSFNKFPWTNMHGFNLDWVIETVKSYTSKVDELAQEIEDVSDTFETKENITDSRKLSETGNFTGTLNGETVTKVLQDILNREKSEDVTLLRKLSEIGNFTGTLNGQTVTQVLVDILNNTSTINDIAEKINSGTSLQYIVDGGVFPFTDPPTIEIDGGVV